MPNGNEKMSFDSFQKLPHDVRLYKLYIATYDLRGRFAAKWVERLTSWSIKIVLGVVLLAMLGLIIIKQNF